jgi:glycosyltransferase involved in cell wall biosynthesis
MLGRLDYERLPAWYSQALAVVVPSVPTRPFLEPWGYVVNEAALHGTPAIASDAVGAAAGGLVRDHETGLVVPAGDAEALARALDEVLSAPQLAGELGVRARDEVAGYTHDAQAHGFEEAFRACGIARPEPAV